MSRLACIVSITVAVACGGKKQEAAPAPGSGSGSGSGSAARIEPGRLVGEAEIQTRLAGLTARLDENAKRRCTPPRIGDALRPGPGTDLLVQLFEGKGELAACMTKLGELGAPGTLKSDFEAGLPSALAFDDACGALIADKVLDAAAHAEGCSPYQVGVRVEPKDFLRPIQLAHALALHAKRLHAGGKTKEAIALSLAGLRVVQDLMRGHVTLIVAMVGVAATQVVADRMDAILDTAKLTEEERALTAAAIDSLLVGVPLWADLMAGERDNMDIYFGAAPLMPKGWTPPGGWNEALRPGSPESALPAPSFGDPRDEHALLLVTSEAAAADQARACPPGASYTACHEGLERLVATAKPAATSDLKALYGELAKASGDVEAVRARIRASIVEILKGVAAPSFAKYSVKIAGMIARLAVVRVHLQVLAGPCPSAEALAAPPFSVIASPPPLGDRLVLAAAPDEVRAGPPAWIDPVKVWAIPCDRAERK